MLQCSGPGPPCRDAQFGGNGLVIDGVRNHLAVLIKDAIEDAWIYPSGDQGFEINLRLLAEAGSCIPAPTAIEGGLRWTRGPPAASSRVARLLLLAWLLLIRESCGAKSETLGDCVRSR